MCRGLSATRWTGSRSCRPIRSGCGTKGNRACGSSGSERPGLCGRDLALSPGVNALIGPNNRGKSAFIRALRAVFYGEARDSLVRAGAKAALVEIGLQAGGLFASPASRDAAP